MNIGAFNQNTKSVYAFAINSALGNAAGSSDNATVQLNSQQVSTFFSALNASTDASSTTNLGFKDAQSIIGNNAATVSTLLEVAGDSSSFEKFSAYDKAQGGNGSVTIADLQHFQASDPTDSPRISGMISYLQSQGANASISSAAQYYQDLTSPPSGASFSAFGSDNQISGNTYYLTTANGQYTPPASNTSTTTSTYSDQALSSVVGAQNFAAAGTEGALGRALNTALDNAYGTSVSASTALNSQQVTTFFNSYVADHAASDLATAGINDAKQIIGNNATTASQLLEATDDSLTFEHLSALDKQNGGTGAVTAADISQYNTENDPRLNALENLLNSQGANATISSASVYYQDLTHPPTNATYAAFGNSNQVSGTDREIMTTTGVLTIPNASASDSTSSDSSTTTTDPLMTLLSSLLGGNSSSGSASTNPMMLILSSLLGGNSNSGSSSSSGLSQLLPLVLLMSMFGGNEK